jgi:excisionase family DNA binding protein
MREKFLYTRKEAAHSLGISVRSLDYLIAAKQLDTRRIGKKVLLTRASLAVFASRNHYGSISAAGPDARAAERG